MVLHYINMHGISHLKHFNFHIKCYFRIGKTVILTVNLERNAD